jgi:hypothetical protein
MGFTRNRRRSVLRPLRPSLRRRANGMPLPDRRGASGALIPSVKKVNGISPGFCTGTAATKDPSQ